MSYKVVINESSTLKGLKSTKVVLVEGTNIGFSVVNKQTSIALDAAERAKKSAEEAKASAEHTDAALGTKVNKSGDTMIGILTVPNVLLSDVQGTEDNAVVRLDYLKSNIQTINDELALKDSIVSVDSKLSLKADITYVDSQDKQLQDNIDQKVDSTEFNTTIQEMGSQFQSKLDLKSDITYVDSELSLKANKTDVQSSLDLKADKTTVQDALDLKSDITYVDSELALKANKTDVQSSLDLKSNITYVDSQLALKADKTTVQAALDLKSNITYVDSQDKHLQDNIDTKVDSTEFNTTIQSMDSMIQSKLDLKLDLTGGRVSGNIYLDTDQDSNLKAFATVGYLNSQITKIAGSPVLSSAWVALRSAMWNGYHAADGVLLDRKLFPDAWAAIQAGLVPVCTDEEWLAVPKKRGCFTTGDGSTTFRIPDYNGKTEGSLGAAFMRGDGRNSAGQAGEIQGDAIRNIKGSFLSDAVPGVTHFACMTGDGVFSSEQSNDVLGGISVTSVTKGDIKRTFDASRVVPTAADNRPVNVTGCWAIKLYGEVQNVGNISIDELATKVTELEKFPKVIPINSILTGINQEHTLSEDECVAIEHEAHYEVNGIVRWPSSSAATKITPLKTVRDEQIRVAFSPANLGHDLGYTERSNPMGEGGAIAFSRKGTTWVNWIMFNFIILKL